jgi:hypothetical protein
MAKVKAPAWCQNAVPTRNGWEDPHTGELFISTNHTQEQIEEFHGVVVPAPAPEPVVEEVVVEEVEEAPQVLNEAPENHKSLDSMTKLELEALGRQHGVELDRRELKATLIGQIKALIS